MNKEDVVCIHNGILFNHKNEIMPFGFFVCFLNFILFLNFT